VYGRVGLFPVADAHSDADSYVIRYGQCGGRQKDPRWGFQYGPCNSLGLQTRSVSSARHFAASRLFLALSQMLQ
jgi:hypothetical protein